MNVFEEVSSFYGSYRGEKRVIGRSAEGRELYALFIGERGGKVGLSQYAIHGREWITALLALEHARRGVSRGGVWIVPLANPDGALLSETGIGSAGAYRAFLRVVNGSDDFSLWKANAQGVDLNVNFDARWGTGAKNRREPAPENFIGSAPCSAPETRALVRFTEEVSPAFTVSWHTKGEEIYWEFHQGPVRRRRDLALARVLSASTGYPLRRAAASAGGYKDWCIERLGIPAFTVEIGSDAARHPLTREDLPALVGRNLGALAALTDAVER